MFERAALLRDVRLDFVAGKLGQQRYPAGSAADEIVAVGTFTTWTATFWASGVDSTVVTSRLPAPMTSRPRCSERAMYAIANSKSVTSTSAQMTWSSNPNDTRCPAPIR